MNIGERINELRREKGWTQEALANKIGSNRVTIAKYESGSFDPSAQALSRLADAFGISADEILGRTESQQHYSRNETPAVGVAFIAIPMIQGGIIDKNKVATICPVYTFLPEDIHADFAMKCNENNMSSVFKKGDVIYYIATDNEKYVWFETEDYKIIRKEFTKDGYRIFIDGKDIYDVFDGMVFAG